MSFFMCNEDPLKWDHNLNSKISIQKYLHLNFDSKIFEPVGAQIQLCFLRERSL